MKKILLSVYFAMVGCVAANAMSYERAQEEALFLTDKMAYELNLNDQQYNDAYEINLDFFLSMNTRGDIYEAYQGNRIRDLRCILLDWQYDLMMAADYFLRPMVWHAGGWLFPVYAHYDLGHFFFGRPSVWGIYRGGHDRLHFHAGFYAARRPVWKGGFRGQDMHRPAPSMAHHAAPGKAGRPSSGMAGRPSSSMSGRSSFSIGGRPSSGMAGRPSSSMNHSSVSGTAGRPSPNMSGRESSGASQRPSGGNGMSGGSRGGNGMSSSSRGNSFDGSSSRVSNHASSHAGNSPTPRFGRTPDKTVRGGQSGKAADAGRRCR